MKNSRPLEMPVKSACGPNASFIPIVFNVLPSPNCELN